MFDINYLVKRVYNKIYKPLYKKRFASFGTNIEFSPYDSIFTYENIYLGNNVSIGYHADFVATRSKIIIGDHVIFGPHVAIRGGDHRVDIIGRYIDSVTDTEKLPENDLNVIFEGDNWIGMNTVILKGVTIGKGSIIGAGSVVTKTIPPYSIAVGVPAKVIKQRFTEEEIKMHEKLLEKK